MTPEPKRIPTNPTPQREGRWWGKFFEKLAETGIVTLAASSAGISRVHVYDLRSRNKEFAARWAEAERLGLAALEDAATKRALATSDRLLEFLLRARLPHKYGERTIIEHAGKISIAHDDAALEAAVRERLERERLLGDDGEQSEGGAPDVLPGDLPQLPAG